MHAGIQCHIADPGQTLYSATTKESRSFFFLQRFQFVAYLLKFR